MKAGVMETMNKCYKYGDYEQGPSATSMETINYKQVHIYHCTIILLGLLAFMNNRITWQL